MNRVLVRCLLAPVLLVAAGLIVWRVLAPAEVLNPAEDTYPAAPARGPGVTGKAAAAPLIVDGRVRVFAAKRQVKADAPVDAKTMHTPRWAFRRWPQQLSGIVAVGTTVISRWSDCELVAIDVRTGRISWRVEGPVAGGYTGDRTGAATVWAPLDLFTAGSTVLARGGGRVSAFEAETGATRWQADCRGDSFATAGGQLVAVDLSTGEVRLQFPLAVNREGVDWKPGRWQVTGRFVAVERLAPDGGRDPYFAPEPVVLAVTG